MFLGVRQRLMLRARRYTLLLVGGFSLPVRSNGISRMAAVESENASRHTHRPQQPHNLHSTGSIQARSERATGLD
ncbi:hypothetical protein BHM03_00023494 [Ensete ventricosum]|nr:hypothetical protein BHM03_00023494 [Ensete ventricosum]